MQNIAIDEKFFRTYLTEKAVQATDFSTLQKHDIHFVDDDYLEFMYDLLWSATVAGQTTYFYIVLKIGEEHADFFYKQLIDGAMQKVMQWHKDTFPSDPSIPAIDKIIFHCSRKDQTNK